MAHHDPANARNEHAEHNEHTEVERFTTFDPFDEQSLRALQQRTARLEELARSQYGDPNETPETWLGRIIDEQWGEPYSWPEHRAEILAALLAEPPRSYSFRAQTADDPPDCPRQCFVYWNADTSLPERLAITYVSNWREVKYNTDSQMGPTWAHQQVDDTPLTLKAAPTPSPASTAPASTPEASELNAPEMPPTAPAVPELASKLDALVEPDVPAVPSIEQLREKAAQLSAHQSIIFGRNGGRTL